mmetsp:Transcript_96111/g.250590  ORF Transcript_96111/g.250590 Transcript_96111/m.250590 type:complete len:106 (-) Transcript_96111:672-989(-)
MIMERPRLLADTQPAVASVVLPTQKSTRRKKNRKTEQNKFTWPSVMELSGRKAVQTATMCSTKFINVKHRQSPPQQDRLQNHRSRGCVVYSNTKKGMSLLLAWSI